MTILRNFVKKLIGVTYGSTHVRRIITGNFGTGYYAIGECNHYLFPARWVTLDFGGADHTVKLTEDLVLPFSDGSQKVAYAAHVLEHLEQNALENILAEIHRTLRPGGGFRLEVPDSERLLHAYVSRDEALLSYFREGRKGIADRMGLGPEYGEDHLTVIGEMASYIDHARKSGHIPVYVTPEEFERVLPGGIEELNKLAQSKLSPEQRTSGGHNNALYFSKLETALRNAGFQRVERVGLGQTIIPGLKLGGGFRRVWDRVPEKARRSFFSLYIDAVK